MVLTLRVVGNSREGRLGRFDTIGSVLSAVAIGSLVLGIHEGPERGWTDGLTLAALVLGAVALAGFIVWELRHARPLLEIRLFADRALAAGSLTLLIVFAVMFGLFLVLVQFLQAVLGYSALRAAAGLLPMAMVMMPLSAVAPVIAKRFGTRRVLMVGLGLFGLGILLLATLVSVEGGYWSVLPGLLVLAVGIGLAMSPSTTAITESLPPEKQGVASALNDTVRELGGAIGIALLGSIVNAGYRSNVHEATAGLPTDVAGTSRPASGRRMRPRRGSAIRRPPCSVPLVMRSSTAGVCRCGSVPHSRRRPFSSSSCVASGRPWRPRRPTPAATASTAGSSGNWSPYRSADARPDHPAGCGYALSVGGRVGRRRVGQVRALVAHVVDVGRHLVHRQQRVGRRDQQLAERGDVLVGRGRATRPRPRPAGSRASDRGSAPSCRWPRS